MVEFFNHEVLQVKDSETHTRIADVCFKFEAPLEVEIDDMFFLLSKKLRIYSIEFCYSGSPYDKQGVVYWLATNKGRDEWSNPSKEPLKAIEVYSEPRTCMGNIEEVVIHDIGQFYPENSEEAFVSLDFRPSNIAIQPTHYTMSYYKDGTGYLLRNWELVGSNDDENFDVIDKHENDCTITEENPTVTFKIDCKKSYTIFEFRITGPDSSDEHFLAISGIEFYGTVYVIPNRIQNEFKPCFAYFVEDSETYNTICDVEFVFQDQVCPSEDLFVLLSSKTKIRKKVFEYSGEPYDEQGIIYWLSTKRKTRKWMNLAESCDYPILFGHPKTNRGRLEDVLVHEIGQWYPDNSEESHLILDLRSFNVAIEVSDYTFSYYKGGNGYLLRNWQLLGSNDGVHYEVIFDHVDDASITEEDPTVTFSNSKNRKPYAMFKMQITGKDSSGHYFFAVSGLELYGTLYYY